MDKRRWHQERLFELRLQRGKQSLQKPWAMLLAIIGGALLIANLAEFMGSRHDLLAALSLGALISGSLWLWNIHAVTGEISERIAELTKELGISSR